jgi:hypothetical protein
MCRELSLHYAMRYRVLNLRYAKTYNELSLRYVKTYHELSLRYVKTCCVTSLHYAKTYHETYYLHRELKRCHVLNQRCGMLHHGSSLHFEQNLNECLRYGQNPSVCFRQRCVMNWSCASPCYASHLD